MTTSVHLENKALTAGQEVRSGLSALATAATELALLGKRLDAAAAAWCRAHPEFFEQIEGIRQLGTAWLIHLHKWARDNPEIVERLVELYQSTAPVPGRAPSSSATPPLAES